MIKVLIVDDHQILIDGIKSLLISDQEIEVVGEAKNGIDALNKLKVLEVDVMLLDLQMPVMDGLETVTEAKKLYPDLKVLMLTTNDEGSIITTLFKHGASGFLLKNSSQHVLIRSIHDAFNGEKVLSAHLTSKMLESLNDKPKTRGIPKISERELEVIKLIAKEYTTQQIADTLYLSTNTVATHKKNLFVKMDVTTSVGMVKKAMDWGLI